MGTDITLSRNNNQPWGFRLSGGADYSFPLTVVRVTIGGLADQCGLKAGDIVTHLNGEPLSTLTQKQAHRKFACAGSNYDLTILRIGPKRPLEKEYYVEYTICK